MGIQLKLFFYYTTKLIYGSEKKNDPVRNVSYNNNLICRNGFSIVIEKNNFPDGGQNDNGKDIRSNLTTWHKQRLMLTLPRSLLGLRYSGTPFHSRAMIRRDRIACRYAYNTSLTGMEHWEVEKWFFIFYMAIVNLSYLFVEIYTNKFIWPCNFRSGPSISKYDATSQFESTIKITVIYM